MIGATYWDWLYINLMWIEDELRGCGYGQQLLLRAEEEGRKRGAKQAYLVQIGRLLWKINWVARCQSNWLANAVEQHTHVFAHYEQTGEVILPPQI
mgnify:CR=1 FL=1